MDVSFSGKEIKYLEDTEFLTVKNEITSKLKILLGTCGKEIRILLKDKFPRIKTGYGLVSPKVSFGENYKGLPYYVLDYPRHFEKESTFSYRIVCLWGKYFTFNLHLAGDALKHINFDNWDEDKVNAADCYVCISDSPWEHYLSSPHFSHVSEISKSEVQELIGKNHFWKISKKATLSTWPKLPVLAQEYFQILYSISGITQPE